MAASTIWIFAGEASGDLYGARLACELRKLEPELAIRGMGSSEMAAAEVDILVDSTELGVVGFIEVLKHYPMFRRLFWGLVRQAEKERPDLVVLIDYPGFNLRFAKEMKKRGIPVLYYISPQVWAWGKKRVPEIAELVERMLVIFPFETDVYKAVDLDARFVGHPLVDIMREKVDETLTRDPNLVLLLPGSRRSEVDRLLLPIVDTARRLHAQRPELRFVISAPRPAIRQRIEGMLGTHGLPIEIDAGSTERWMQKASAGIAASGTVTVQAAILGLPLVVVYRMNPLTHWMAMRLINVPYITMVNLVADQLVFQEFVQHLDAQELADALLAILPEGARHAEVLAGIERCVSRLQTDCDASVTAAAAVHDSLCEFRSLSTES
ncbi:MAG: lipid-A-disaccharide synthase [Rhodothermales bacterium]|jgi:lipid-A-disaccharide synthase